MRENMKKTFLLQGMKRDINIFSMKCLECQKVKAEHQHLGELLHPHDIPTHKWQTISMNFIIGLPKTRFQHDAILVVVDKLTNAHFIPENVIDDASIIAQKFVKEIVRLNRFLEIVISNRDSRFTSEFWQALHNALGTK